MILCARSLICLSVAFFAHFHSAQAQDGPSYEITAVKNEMVGMRDGVRLATDIYRPARNGSAVEGKFPVILERTPYNKDSLSVAASHYVPHGYIVIAQDVRGRYRSEGKWRPIRDDPQDGFDTAQWIGSQPWCNGKIGTMGSSYDGATQ
ncbi:MAG: CocE/NonD family hydrolase, partial [Acidobacteriaceae bacterium]|nr:CocE/NonD family hydrolase [Acidobacteriaceae bacterium]